MISGISSYNSNRTNFRANAKNVAKTAVDLGAKVVNKAPKGLTDKKLSAAPVRFDDSARSAMSLSQTLASTFLVSG